MSGYLEVSNQAVHSRNTPHGTVATVRMQTDTRTHGRRESFVVDAHDGDGLKWRRCASLVIPNLP